MDTIDLVIEATMKFYDNLTENKYSRDRSWEHYYSAFMTARKSEKVAYDYLSLQLGF